jgi:uncharacterized membrane protein AbrB (regulator of aidB expression)
MANLAFRELYSDIITWNTEERRNNPITGKMRWITCAVVLLETSISLKFRKNAGNILDNPWPNYISIPWISFFVGMFLFYLYLRFKPNHTTKYPSISA